MPAVKFIKVRSFSFIFSADILSIIMYCVLYVYVLLCDIT